MPDIKTIRTAAEIKILAADDGTQTLPTEIEILKAGSWDTPNHGKFDISESDLDEYVDNFNKGTRKGIPIDLEHKTDSGAVGWVQSLRRVGNSLMGGIDWTQTGATLLKDKAYKYFSPEFVVSGYKDPEGKLAADRNVLLAGALTNRPLFKDLQAIVANDKSKDGNSGNNVIYAKGDSMQLDEVRKKTVADLTQEEKTFLGENKDSLSNAEQIAFGLVEVAAPVVETPAAAAPIEAAPVAGEPAAVAASDKTVTGKEGETVTISASELDTLKKGAELGKIAHAELEHKKASDQVEGYITAGEFKPGGKDAITNFVLSLNDEQRKVFANDVVGNIQTQTITAGEIGSSEQGSIGTAAKALDEKANEIMASEKISYASAVKKAGEQNPQLYKEYEAELKPTNQLTGVEG